MKINGKVFALAAITLTTITISVWLVLWASEAFFFDKFYYQKSVQHGYWVPGRNLSPKDFGKRGQDIADLTNFIHDPSRNALGAQTDKNFFTIAVIGDSYVWGQGIKDEDRFVNILEKRLNTIRPTRIISLSAGGDSTLDNYIKYYYLTKTHHIDLAVFGVVDNDFLLRTKNLYDSSIQQELINACNKTIVYDLPEPQASASVYEVAKKQSYDVNNFGNWCIFEKVLDDLPKNNTVFFNYGDNFGFPDLLKKYTNMLTYKGYIVVSPLLKGVEESKLHVSQKDPHPSAYANRFFANALYEKIIKLEYFRR